MSKIFNFFKTNFGFFILISIIVFSLYGKSINYELLDLDDVKSINENIEFISDYRNIPKLFLKDCFYENIYFYYRPVLSLSFAVEAIFFKENPKPYHFVNIILFIFTFYLMFFLLQKLNFNNDILKFIILIFLVHPIFASNVVYVSTRAEMLLVIFSSLSIINLINFLDKNKFLNFLMTIVFFVFSIFTKETGLMLIPICITIIYCFNLRISKKQMLCLIVPVFISIIFYFYLRSIAVPKLPVSFFVSNMDFYLNNIITGMLLYTYKIFIPGNIAIILDKIKINYEYILFSFVLYSILSYLFYKKILDRKIIVFSLIWFLLMLFPTFIINDYQFLFHRILTAFLGVIMILVLLIDNIISKYPISKQYLLILFSILFFTYSFASYKQADKYKNSDILWLNAYFDCPDYSLVLASIGKMYCRNGEIEIGYKYLKKAIKDEASLKKYSKDLACLFIALGYLDAAERIVQYCKGDYIYYDIMTIVYNNKNDFKKAILYAKKANEIKPYDSIMLSKLSRLYALNNDLEKAKETLLKIKNKTADNYYVLAMLYEDLKDKQNAVETIKKAIELEPDNQKYQLLLSEFLEKNY